MLYNMVRRVSRNSYPRGDGNPLTTLLTDLGIESQFVPARGRKPLSLCVLDTPYSRNSYPRGDGNNSRFRYRGLRCSRNSYPRGDGNKVKKYKGLNETGRNSYPRGDGNSSVPMPTLCMTGRNSYPRGDGNIKLHYLPISRTESQFVPARGRKLSCRLRQIKFTFVAIRTREGRKLLSNNEAYGTEESQFVPARGRKRNGNQSSNSM